jgi:hypothetical protein
MFYPLTLCSLIVLYLAIISDLIPKLPTSDTADMSISILFVIVLVVFGIQSFAKQHKSVAVVSFVSAGLIFGVAIVLYSILSSF